MVDVKPRHRELPTRRRHIPAQRTLAVLCFKHRVELLHRQVVPEQVVPLRSRLLDCFEMAARPP
jgi:hypothetical protein